MRSRSVPLLPGGKASYIGKAQGHVAEWLRNGLQNRVHRFNSGRGLQHFPARSSMQDPRCRSLKTAQKLCIRPGLLL